MKTLVRSIMARARGKVLLRVNGVKVAEIGNAMLAGMGYIFADAIKTGTSKMISDMFAHKVGGSGRIEFSTPARQSGGRGLTDEVVVQSEWVNTTGAGVDFDKFWLSAEAFDASADYLDIANVENLTISVPNAATLTIDWTIQIPSSTCSLEDAQRFQLAKGINPEVAHGGTINAITQGQFVFSVGNTGLFARNDAIGGGGFSQVITIDLRYTHAAAAVVVNESEYYNSNNDLAYEQIGLAIDLANGEHLQGLLTVTWLGVVEGGGGDPF